MDETNRQERPRTTTVLTDEERRSFQGMTIDEDGQETKGSDMNSEGNPFAEGRFSQGTGMPGIKVYTWSSLGWKGKLILALVVCIVVAIVIFFGSIFLIGFGIIAGLAAIVTLLRIVYRMLSS
ncbi:hypothetical protein [Veillonella magna]|uniref:Transcriptional regulator n=1 Tax=Veillonella magna TaxID=464322 RepID=A0ABS2GGI6_9FIRM|nr:hypothetical protein [Veillonella magna]MBM6824152.1 hypothetical protein [Veillonella magna]MBM6912445.1 hypothetical protein [Veillonella magna]